MSQEEWTEQKVFDTAASGILKQGRRCADSLGNCMYRLPGGLKCAAGFIFSDEEVEGMSNYNSSFVIHERATHLIQYDCFILELQCIHDEVEVAGWPEALREMAKRQGLSSKVIDDWEKENEARN